MYLPILKKTIANLDDLIQSTENQVDYNQRVIEVLKSINDNLKRISEDAISDAKSCDSYADKQELEMTRWSDIQIAQSINAAYEQSQNDGDVETIADDILKASGINHKEEESE